MVLQGFSAFDMDNPFLQKKPFDATGLGIAVNTVKGLPKAALDVAASVGQGFTRSIASAGLTLAKPLGGQDQLSYEGVKSPFGQELFKNFFGTEPVKPIEDNIAQAELAIKASPFAQKTGLDKYALPLAFGGVFGSTALDLTPVGALEKNAVKVLAEETSPKIINNILRSMNVPEDVATKFAPHFADTRTVQEAQDVLDTMKGSLGVRNISTAQDVYRQAADVATEVPLSKLQVGEDTLNAAGDFSKGLASHSNLPILVKENPTTGLLEIIDGNHRYIQAADQGASSVRVMTDASLYKKLAAAEETFLSKAKPAEMGTYKSVVAHERGGTGGVSEYLRKIQTQGKRGFAKNPFIEGGAGTDIGPLPKSVSEAESLGNNITSKGDRYAQIADEAFRAKTPSSPEAGL